MGRLPNKPRVYGLDRFGLAVAELTRLGHRTVHLHVQLRGRSVRQLVNLSPRQRMATIRISLGQQLEQLKRAFPGLEFVPRSQTRAWTIDVMARADQIAKLARRREVTSLFVDSIDGRRAKTLRQSRRWFCVWVVLAGQIERRTQGQVTLEDRLVVVKAHSTKDADARVRQRCRRETEPYLNTDGELVRWAFVSVKDVFELFDDAISPDGTEVYSRLRSARMRPEFVWRSRTTLRSRRRARAGEP